MDKETQTRLAELYRQQIEAMTAMLFAFAHPDLLQEFPLVPDPALQYPYGGQTSTLHPESQGE